jgi:adenylate cyclase
VTAQQSTKGTEIAALEARRNVELVRAEGSLLGEKRAAIARFAMIALYAIVSTVRGGPRNWAQFGVGVGYTVFAALLLIGLVRFARPDRRRSSWVPMVTTTIDYGTTTALGLLDVWWTGEWQPAQHAITASILLAFALARVTLWHVAYAYLLAEISFVVFAVYAGFRDAHVIAFVMCGFTVLALLVALTNRAIGPMFHGLRTRDNLTRFLPRQVAERVIQAGPSALVPVEREVTVLFSDIRGFTSMSEGRGPREVLSMLDDYFGRMSQIVKGHDGVVGKFIGDGLLAFWGVPDRLADHAARAVRAARDMRVALRELNRYRVDDGAPPIKIGIGIHTGTVAAGMLGGQLQSEYTIIGDAVNVASRIEGLTKEHGVDLLVSETTWAQLGGTIAGRRLSAAEIRGRKESVVLYTIDVEEAAA